MKLTRLELSGFKSFADTVTLTFEQGVTAIVGPNGCGKSNVSDAVRWVLGEQSARLLRGGKMEDVIFQGSTARRPVNVTEVSLFLDNSDGDLPDRLPRGGRHPPALPLGPERLPAQRLAGPAPRHPGPAARHRPGQRRRRRDRGQDDRPAPLRPRRRAPVAVRGGGRHRALPRPEAQHRAAPGGDRRPTSSGWRTSSPRSSPRSGAWRASAGKARAARVKLTEEKFAVQITLARRLLEKLSAEAAGMEAALHRADRAAARGPPAARRGRAASRGGRSRAGRPPRGSGPRSPAGSAPSGSKSGSWTATWPSPPSGWPTPPPAGVRAQEERSQMELRVQQALVERDASAADHDAAAVEHERIRGELAGRAEAEEDVRRRLGEQRAQVRQWEQELQARAQTLRSLEGERAALEGELASLRERAAGATAHRAGLQGELAGAERRRDHAVERAGFLTHESKRAAAEAEHARHLVAEAREQEAMHRSDRRRAEESLAQMTARRHALEELERDRVGLAPAAAALLAARERFDGGILGPLSDFVSTDRDDAELAERLLGDWMHAVLVRDRATVDAVQALARRRSSRARWCCCRSTRGRSPATRSSRSMTVCGSKARRPAGCARRSRGARCSTRRAGCSGARAAPSSCPAPPAPSGPLRRRAELATLGQEVERATARRSRPPRRRCRPRSVGSPSANGRWPPRPRPRTWRARPSASARRRARTPSASRGNLAREMAESEAAADARHRAAHPRRAAPGRDRRRPRRGRHVAEPTRPGARQRAEPAGASWRPSRRRPESSGCTGRCRKPTWRAGSGRRRSGSSAPPRRARRPSAPCSRSAAS